MSGILFSSPRGTPVNGSGRPYPGAKRYFYRAGTQTLATIYSDSTLAVPLSNPVPADSAGKFPAIYIDPNGGDYKTLMTNSSGVQIEPAEDNIPAAPSLSVLSIGQAIYPPTAAEIAVDITPTYYQYEPGDVRRYGAVGDGATDDTTAVQAAVAVGVEGGIKVRIPGSSAYYKITSSITVDGAVSIEGDGMLCTILRFWGCDGFVIAEGEESIRIQGMELFSLSATGVVDPRAYNGIVVQGISGNQSDFMNFRELYLRGWATCLYCNYLWNSTFDTIHTINSNIGIRFFGQCVSNSVVSCSLVVNEGTASIQTVKDGAVRGEGLTIVNTATASGSHGISSDGFLSLNVANSVIDQATDVAISLSGVQALMLSNNWIYGEDGGISIAALGLLTSLSAQLVGNRIQTVSASSSPIVIGDLNADISIIGGSLECPATGGYCLALTGAVTDISVIGTQLINNGSNDSISVASGSTLRHNGLNGDVTISYAAAEAFTATLTGCTTSPTGSVKYSVSGELVTLQIPGITATSNTTAATLTGMPTALKPITAQVVTGITTNNGAEAVSRLEIGTNGTITLYNGTTVFTNSGTKGVSACTVTYRRYS